MGYQRGVSGQEVGVSVLDATTGAAFAGTVTAYRSVNGAAQVAAAGTVEAQGHGQFVLVMDASDIPGPETSFWFEGTGAVPVEITVLTGRGTLYRATAGQHLGFGLVSTSTGGGLPGATVSVYATIDGAAQVAGSGTVTDLGRGQYDYSPSAADLTGTDIVLTFVASGAVQVTKTLTTVDVADGPEPGASGAGADIQAALVAYLQTCGAVTSLLGASPKTRLYPEFAPPDAAGIWCCYTLEDDQRPLTLGGRAGYGIARIRLDCWADGAPQGHLKANQLYLALWGVLNGYRGPMGDLFVQRSNCENGAKNTPQQTAAGKVKPEANASLEVVLWFNDTGE